MQHAYELAHALKTFRRTTLIVRDNSGLKNAEKFFLLLLASLNNGAPVKPSEAAKELNVTLAAVTHYINSLEGQGLVVRTPSPDDRRVVLVSLSERGKETVDSLRKIHLEEIRGIVEYLGDKDSAAFVALITKITEYVKQTGAAKESLEHEGKVKQHICSHNNETSTIG
jgi:DNA-binding MarR family transcriptional regulator